MQKQQGLLSMNIVVKTQRLLFMCIVCKKKTRTTFHEHCMPKQQGLLFMEILCKTSRTIFRLQNAWFYNVVMCLKMHSDSVEPDQTAPF